MREKAELETSGITNPLKRKSCELEALGREGARRSSGHEFTPTFQRKKEVFRAGEPKRGSGSSVAAGGGQGGG